MKKEKLKDQKAFFKKYDKRVKKRKNTGGYCMEDFAFDMFVKTKRLKKKLKRILNDN